MAPIPGDSSKHDAARGPSTPSLDHLVGRHEQCLGNCEAERLCCLQVDDQLELDGLLDGQISRFVTFEAELLGVCTSLPDAATARWYYSAAIDPGVFGREAILRRTMSM